MKIASIALLVFLFSCKFGVPKNKQPETRDVLLKKYFTIADSMPYYDTSNTDYRLLKAYYLNDTSMLAQLQSRAEQMKAGLSWESNLDSCMKQPAFKDIQSDEAYRFSYSASFCPYTTSVTIVKYERSITLKTIVCQDAWGTKPCQIIDSSSTAVDSVHWDKFEETLKMADFWGLMPDNGRSGLDGSTLVVYGFRKGWVAGQGPDKIKYVYRWSPGNQAIFKSLLELLKLSKTKKGCLTAS